MKVLFLTKYGTKGASSRYRSYQYIPYLKENGISITIAALFDDDYLEKLYNCGRVALPRIALYYVQRLTTILNANRFDVTWIEKELFPWLPFFLEAPLLVKLKPYVVDYDDAIFHGYDQHRFTFVRSLLGQKIDQVMKCSTLVVAGNDYLAQRAIYAGASAVEILPTVIDLKRYPLHAVPKQDIFTVGWIGSPTTTRYISTIEQALRVFCASGKSIVRIVGGKNLSLSDVPIEILPWSEQEEFEMIKTFDVGIMPLSDSPWEHGKCGFKLIQYMACALPVIASPIGVNSTIVTDGYNGFLATSQDDWITALCKLRDNEQLRLAMGLSGRQIVEESYCLQVTAPKLLKLLSDIASPHN